MSRQPGDGEPGALTVLVVEDQRDIRSMIARYLTLNGFAVTEAGDGQTALDLVSAGASFRFLLTDLSLPDLDGRDVARSIRKLSPTTWAAIITGWTLEPDEFLPWGIDHVFSKPLDLADLCRTLAAATPRPRPRGEQY